MGFARHLFGYYLLHHGGDDRAYNDWNDQPRYVAGEESDWQGCEEQQLSARGLGQDCHFRLVGQLWRI